MGAALERRKRASQKPLGRKGWFVDFTSNRPRTVGDFYGGPRVILKTTRRGADFVVKLLLRLNDGGSEFLPLIMGIESNAASPRDSEDGFVEVVGRAPYSTSKLNDRGTYKDRLGW